MQLRRSVKAAAVASLTDARYFAALGVDYVGFAVGPGGISLAEAAAVREWIAGPLIVAECGDESAEQIATVTEHLRPDAVQVGAFSTAVAGVNVRAAGGDPELPVLQSFVLGGDLTLDLARSIVATTAAGASGYVCDARGLARDWTELRGQSAWLDWLGELSAEHPVWLEANVAAVDLDALLAALPRVGLQLRGGEEEAVGVKSFDELDALFERLEVE